MVPGVLSDPSWNCTGSGNVIASNNNWKLRDADDSSQQAEIESTTIPPTNDLECALIATLNSGNYTIVVRGVAGATGVATVEFTISTSGSAGGLARTQWATEGSVPIHQRLFHRGAVGTEPRLHFVARFFSVGAM